MNPDFLWISVTALALVGILILEIMFGPDDPDGFS